MVQLEILTGKTAGSFQAVRRFPFVLGRDPKSNLCLEGDGVWDRHATIVLKSREGFSVRAEANALLSINGERTAEKLLRNGDTIEMGSARARFWLAPAVQKRLGAREALVWATAVLVTLLQIAVIYLLG